MDKKIQAMGLTVGMEMQPWLEYGMESGTILGLGNLWKILTGSRAVLSKVHLCVRDYFTIGNKAAIVKGLRVHWVRGGILYMIWLTKTNLKK